MVLLLAPKFGQAGDIPAVLIALIVIELDLCFINTIKQDLLILITLTMLR